MNLDFQRPSRGLRSHVLPALALGAAIAVSGVAWSQAPTQPFGRTTRVIPDSAQERVVRVVFQGNFDRVRIERSEPGAAANLHPVTALSAEDLRSAMAALRRADRRDAELFNADELAVIVPPLVQALAEVSPQQEVTFAVVGRHGALGPLVERSVTTGRLFRTAEGLQLIVGLAQQPYEGQFLATGVLIAFEPGSRAAPVDAKLRLGAPGTTAQRRGDWVTLALGAAAAGAAPVAAPAGVPAAVPAPAGASPAAPAAVVPAPVQAGSPPAPAAVAPVPTTRTPAFLAEQEERLKTLKRLRDQDLITEEEYQQKRREILQLL